MIEKMEELEQITCIWYPVCFKDRTEVLLDSESKVNIISQAFASQPGLKIRKMNIRDSKIDGTTLKTYEIVISTFSLSNKDKKKRFFEKNFLLTNVNPNSILGMLFLTMSNVDIDFQAWDL